MLHVNKPRSKFEAQASANLNPPVALTNAALMEPLDRVGRRNCTEDDNRKHPEVSVMVINVHI